MKVYFLFGGDRYYPLGGAYDFMGLFHSIDQAKEYFAKNPEEWGVIAVFEHEDIKPVLEISTRFAGSTNEWEEVKDDE